MARASLLAILIVLSGCLAATEAAQVKAELETQDSMLAGTQSDTIDCGDQVELELRINRLQGRLQVRVMDGDGAVAFDENFTETGHDARSLFGAPGTWKIHASHNVTSVAYEARITCG